MTKAELQKIYHEYCLIKTKAMCGARVSRAEALKALKLKKILNKNNYWG